MGWENEKQLSEARNKGIERQLFPQLSEEEQQVVKYLRIIAIAIQIITRIIKIIQS